MTRVLAHEPLGWRPTLVVTVRRYGCTGCVHVWRQDTSKAAAPRAKLSCGGLRWALQAIVCQHLDGCSGRRGLGVAWNTANDAVLVEGRRVLIAGPARLLGINEGTLGNWVNTYRREHPVSDQPLSVPDRARLRELERENRELRMQVEFLKEAAALFARDQL